ncbi:SIR2 family NAD-dependent protein deacylase, partial [Streptomyces sp. NPDC004596]
MGLGWLGTTTAPFSASRDGHRLLRTLRCRNDDVSRPPMPCDSGIPDYRGPDGLWRRDPETEKLVTYEHYMGDPEIRRRAWLMRRDSGARGAEPNAAHRAVAELERSGVPVRVVTQNVDGLHQLAGMPARKVLELHGTARSVVCTRCHARGPMEDALA